MRNNDQTSHHGPLTRTVADSALMLEVMAGPHPLDHYSLEAPPAADLRALLERLRASAPPAPVIGRGSDLV